MTVPQQDHSAQRFADYQLSDWFTLLLQQQQLGCSVLPAQLGLSNTQFTYCCQTYQLPNPPLSPHNDLRQELLELRQDEFDDVVAMLSRYLHKDDEASWLLPVLAAGSLGARHLWEDLGLPHRQALNDMIAQQLPALYRDNDKNMRWKRFFYRQLCEATGDYICRAPTCGECSGYQECFVGSND